MRFLRGVIQRAKTPDLFQPAQPIERIEILRVAGGEFARFQITAAQICVAKSVGTLPGEKMKAQPAAIGARDALGFAKESDEEKENEISIDLRLELEVAREIFRCDLAPPFLNCKAACRAWFSSSTKMMSERMFESLRPLRGSCRSSWSMSQRE